MDKIVCIGKNYLEHAKELNALIGDTIPEKPVLFLKPPSCVFNLKPHTVNQIEQPFSRGEIHHECEVVLKIKKNATHIKPNEAKTYIESFTLGLDMTIRDLQGQLKKNGHPWEVAKVFKNAAIVGDFINYEKIYEYSLKEFEFLYEDKLRQKGRLEDMSLGLEECVAYASQFFELYPGDLIFTGTSAGVGKVEKTKKSTMLWNDIHYDLIWA